MNCYDWLDCYLAVRAAHQLRIGAALMAVGVVVMCFAALRR